MERQPFYLWNRSGVWYYRLPSEKTYHSTRVRAGTGLSKRKAERWVLENVTLGATAQQTFRGYADPFFDWERCPRIRRLLREQKSIGRNHAGRCRTWLVKHVFPDPFAGLQLAKIKRGDVLDLRERLAPELPGNTLNKVIGTVKTVLAEASYREDIATDPGARIGAINYPKSERGLLSVDELRQLFSHDSRLWRGFRAFAAFNLAARIGARRGEVLALTWDDVDFAGATIRIRKAWKSSTELGPPKSGKPRMLPIASGVLDPLAELYEDGIRVAPPDLVFCHDDGSRLGEGWWRQHFASAMNHAEIDAKGRGVTPHSLRHSLNSHLLAAGVDAAKIRAYLGWSDRGAVLTPVQAGYTRWTEDALGDVARAVEELLDG